MPQAIQVSQTALVPPQTLAAEVPSLGPSLLSPGAIGAVRGVVPASSAARSVTSTA